MIETARNLSENRLEMASLSLRIRRCILVNVHRVIIHDHEKAQCFPRSMIPPSLNVASQSATGPRQLPPNRSVAGLNQSLEELQLPTNS